MDLRLIRSAMSEEKKEPDRIVLEGESINKFFPKSYTPRQKQKLILILLKPHYKKLQRNMER